MREYDNKDLASIGNRGSIMRKICFFLLLLCSYVLWGKDAYNVDSKPVEDTMLHENSKYIAVIGDIQIYTSSFNRSLYYFQTLSWISMHSDNIAFILQVGDLTNNNYRDQWERFYSTTLPYTCNVPFYACIGNHDYICSKDPFIWNLRDSTKFNSYIAFPSTISHIVASYESSHYENIVIGDQLFDGDSIYLLILEMEPRLSVVKWAIQFVENHPSKRFVLLNHRYLNKQGQRYTECYVMKKDGVSAEYLWQNLVYPHDNIRCVLCGHIGVLSRLLYSDNAWGREIPQVEFNIQKMPHGGDGLIQLWEFPKGNDSVYVRTFNTQTQQFYRDSITEFQFKYR